MRLRQRLERLERATNHPVDVELTLDPSPPAAEAAILAGELAAAFAELVTAYRQRYGLSQTEGIARASESNPVYEEQVLRGPPDQVSWFGLDDLARRDPQLALRRWEEVKQAAREELTSGHRAARVMEGFNTSCWDRARFLALYNDLVEAWHPRNGLERQLIGMMAQAQTAMLAWHEILTTWTALMDWDCTQALEGQKQHESPRLSDAEAMERAAGMADRFHKMFLRTLRALCSLRKVPLAVIVQHAGQVNVGQQQVNVTAGGS